MIKSYKKLLIGLGLTAASIAVVLAALTTNLTSYYSFDNSNSTDSVGSNNGSDTAITYSSANGKINVGAGFSNASASTIDLGGNANLATAAITYNCWIKASSFPNAYNAIIAKNNTADTLFVAYYVKSNGKMAAYLNNGIATIFYDGTGSNTLSTGTWYMATMRYDSTSGLRVDINAASDGTAAANGALSTLSTGLDVKISNQNTYTNRYWDGAIDECGIWSRYISDAEVTQLYNSGNGLNPVAPATTQTGTMWFKLFRRH